MAVFRVNKDKNYTVMSNYHFRDNRLSLKAKGLLSEMLSLPNDWDYSLAGLVAINKEEEHAIKSAINELKDCGYVVITKLMPNHTESKKIEYIYDIFEKPNQDPNFQPLEVQPLENPVQLNTKEQKTKEQKDYYISDTVSKDDVQKVVDAWNTVGLAKVRKILPNTERYKSLVARIKEYGMDDVMEALEKVRKSKFLHGDNKDGWKADFEFFVAPNRFPRILEGKYDGGEKEYF